MTDSTKADVGPIEPISPLTERLLKAVHGDIWYDSGTFPSENGEKEAVEDAKEAMQEAINLLAKQKSQIMSLRVSHKTTREQGFDYALKAISTVPVHDFQLKLGVSVAMDQVAAAKKDLHNE
jgi:hypothetical protein